MEKEQFDHLTRTQGTEPSRRTLLFSLAGSVLSVGISAESEARHKKHKRKCAKKCPDGCCTSKYGKCVNLVDQTDAQCGTSGEICRNTGCPQCDTAFRRCPSGQCCSGSGTCGACVAFVTSTTYTGNLNGWVGARTICDARAASAGLRGHFQPWLSDGNISPVGTVLLNVGPNTRFTLVDGTPLSNSRAELTSGTLRHAIDQTETGAVGSSDPDQVWTNALPDGQPTDSVNGHCAGWTSTSGGFGKTGLATNTNQTWTTGTSAPCSASRRLYCFQYE